MNTVSSDFSEVGKLHVQQRNEGMVHYCHLMLKEQGLLNKILPFPTSDLVSVSENELYIKQHPQHQL